MPLKTLRVRPSPTSSVSRSSLVEPSTASQSTIRAMRRSTLAKSSMLDLGAIGFAAGRRRAVGRRPAARTAHRAASRRPAASGAGTRRSRARRAAGAGVVEGQRLDAAGRPRPARPAPAAPASGRSSAAGTPRCRRCRPRAARPRAPACFASSHGLCWSTYSLTRSASSMISRSALPNSRSSYSARDRRRAAARSASSSVAAVAAERRPPACRRSACSRKPAARLAMLTYLPTRSLLTRATKSSGLKSMSSTLRVQLGGDVVAQPLRVQAELEVAQRRDAGAAALAHLLAADGDEAVHEHVGRRLAAAELQHRRPEQRVEVDDVLADEVDLLDRRVGHELVERARLAARAAPPESK